MSRPTIYITKMTPSIDIKYLLYGMEEEGIPSEIRGTTQKELIKAAYEQALKSPLAVGIAIDEKQAVLHYKNLPEEEPLFMVENKRETMMTLGKNAARLVKGIPFKLDV
ncbi:MULTISPECIES: glycerol dehydratase reactivase beta/small subunit family protein [Vagococcus]|uniref:glycerol dehydratase reactivase beta/small subunit family protein n=1 Tax=Vagococcus TaxID=2737 RepID=UPI00211B08FC|nr:MULTISPECIES: glycerol dehydratase reactivase beta/small subunit family protein [Vagococcus]